jgi:hypothetical protein
VDRNRAVGIATRYGLDGAWPNPSGGQTALASSDRHTGPCSLLWNGHWFSFPGVNRMEHGANHPSPSSADFKDRAELFLFSPSRPSLPVLWRRLPFSYLFVFHGQPWNPTVYFFKILGILRLCTFLAILYELSENGCIHMPKLVAEMRKVKQTEFLYRIYESFIVLQQPFIHVLILLVGSSLTPHSAARLL